MSGWNVKWWGLKAVSASVSPLTWPSINLTKLASWTGRAYVPSYFVITPKAEWYWRMENFLLAFSSRIWVSTSFQSSVRISRLQPSGQRLPLPALLKFYCNTVLLICLPQGIASFFKGPDGKYFKLCRSHISHTYFCHICTILKT